MKSKSNKKSNKPETEKTDHVAKPKLVKVALLDPVETLWAEDLGDNRYRLDNAPIGHTHVVHGDIVEALPASDRPQPVVTKVFEKSGNVAIGIIALLNPFPEEYLRFTERLEKLGCIFESMVAPVGVLTVPPTVNKELLEKELSRPEIIRVPPGEQLTRVAMLIYSNTANRVE
jgi:hypothetical protein